MPAQLLPPGLFDVVSVVVSAALRLEVPGVESVCEQVRHSVAEPFELDADGVHVWHNVSWARGVLEADRVHVGQDVSLNICEDGADRDIALDALRVEVGSTLDEVPGTLVLELELLGTVLELELLEIVLEVQVEHKVLLELLGVELDVQVGHKVLELEMRVLDADMCISELGKTDELKTHVGHIVEELL